MVEDVAVQVGFRFQSQSRASGMDPISINFGPTLINTPRIESAPAASRDRAYISVRWSAKDENDDDLLYALYYRGDNERDWKLLKSGITEKFYSFESGLLPDGGYTLKVVATDAPSHTPEDALTDERRSQRFEVDNTPPRILNLAARIEAQQLHVTFQATDDFSAIKRAEYSIDAGEWQYLEPVGKLSDAKTENYDFNYLLSPPQQSLEEQAETRRGKSASKNPAPSTGEHVVVVRVYDRYDNAATARNVTK